MCGRYTLASDIAEFLDLFDLDVPEELAHPRRYNIAPSQPVLGVVADPAPRVEIMEWGFVPSWARPDSNMRSVINARVESLAEEKPYFKGAFKSARCVILADGFYEWKSQKGEKGKRPYRIGLKDKGIFAMAGLWSMPRTEDGSERVTSAIITVPANEFMKDIHDRMPAILRVPDLTVWLDPKARSTELFKALEPYPADQMSAYEVGMSVNNPRHDSPDCVRSIEDEE